VNEVSSQLTVVEWVAVVAVADEIYKAGCAQMSANCPACSALTALHVPCIVLVAFSRRCQTCSRDCRRRVRRRVVSRFPSLQPTCCLSGRVN
jgi:transposase-like protein